MDRVTDWGCDVANQVPADVAFCAAAAATASYRPRNAGSPAQAASRAGSTRRNEQAEQGARVAVPAPRQIGGDGRQSIDPFGNGWAARFGLGHRACKLSTGGSAWEAVGPLTREPVR